MSKNKHQIEYLTQYVVDGKLYGNSIFAKSKKQAERHLEDKRMTERIIGRIPDKFYITPE